MGIPSTLRQHHRDILILGILVVLHFLVKGLFLGDKSVSGDEPFSVYHAQMSIGAIVDQLSQGNNPPLYEMMLHYWIQWFGISSYAVRFPSLIFSGITTLLIYLTGIRFFNPRIGLYASIIFIFSNYHILLAQEARVYALLGMLSMASMYLFMGLLKQDQTQRSNEEQRNATTLKITHVVLLGVVNVMLMYAHYFGFFILWTQFLFLLFDIHFFKRHWKSVVVYVGVLGLGYAPYLKVLVHRFVDSSGGTWVQPPEGIESLYHMLWTFTNKPLVTVVVLAILGLRLVQYLIHRPTDKALIFSRFVVFWFWSIVLFMFGISFWIPIFMDRYLMPGAIAFPLLIGICADALVKKSWYRYVVPFMVCGLFVATVKPNSSNGRDIEAIVSKVKSLQTTRSLVFFCPDWFDLNFAYYYHRAYFMDYNEVHIKDNIRKHLHADHVFPISHAVQISQQPMDEVNRIIYLDTGADFTYPNNGIRPYLAAHFNLEEQFLFDELFQVLVYEKK